jgi:AcrR family transcriptional regulator
MSSDERRNVILQAAGRLFEHYGHGKTTMADVAREAGIGVGTVYLEFASKEAIVEALSLSSHVAVLAAMRAAALRTDDHATRLGAVLIARTETFLALRRKGQHACDLLHCASGAVHVAREHFRNEEGLLFDELIFAGQEAGAFGAMDPTRAAMLIQRAFVSLTPPLLPEGDEEALRLAADLTDLVLRGLVARSGHDLSFTPSAASARSKRAEPRATSRAPKKTTKKS